jgi:hypothetical protein
MKVASSIKTNRRHMLQILPDLIFGRRLNSTRYSDDHRPWLARIITSEADEFQVSLNALGYRIFL